jgi:hypothetical protein
MLAFPFIVLFFGFVLGNGISLESPAAIATPCARPNFSIDYVFAKKGASAISSGLVSSTQWYVQVSDNGCMTLIAIR